MKVNDIKPDDLRAGQRDAMQRDIDWLAARRKKFVTVGCPACGGENRRELYEKCSMPQVLCIDCETQYACPRPDDRMLGEFYRQSSNYAYWAKYIYPASEETRRTKIFRPRAELAAKFAERNGIKSGTIVEVGAAYGLFCEELSKLGVFGRVIGIEPTPNLAALCRKKGIETIEATYEETEIDEPVDLIAAFEVIEHLYAPKRFLQWAFSSLRPGGFVMLSCPNVKGFDTLVLGKEADAVDHEHLNLFHPGSIRILAERAGFGSVEVTTPGRLDFDIVRTALENGVVTGKQVGAFLETVLRSGDDDTGAKFQSFLQQCGLSSNMLITARRP